MIPNGTKIKIFVCKMCLQKCKSIVITKETMYRKYCDKCKLARQKMSQKLYWVKSNKDNLLVPVGRPKLEKQFYGSEDIKFTWDGVLEYGGLI